MSGPDPHVGDVSDGAPAPADPVTDAVGDPASDADGTDFADTGDPRVDSAMQRLAGVADLPASQQVAEYEAVHQVLQNTLATVDEA